MTTIVVETRGRGRITRRTVDVAQKPMRKPRFGGLETIATMTKADALDMAAQVFGAPALTRTLPGVPAGVHGSFARH